MKSPSIVRFFSLTAFTVGCALAAAGCQGNTSNVGGSSGPSGQTDVRSSGVGVGGHQPATNSSTHASGAGPAGSQ